MPRIAKDDGPCFVYLFSAADTSGVEFVKVGMSVFPESRLASVQTGCPIKIGAGYKVKCPCSAVAKALESAMHQRFADRKSCGEWIRFESDGLAQVAAEVEKMITGRHWPMSRMDIETASLEAYRARRKKEDDLTALELDRFRKEVRSKGFAVKF
jgi:hypothetical protein